MLKLSGIYIVWSEVYKASHQPTKAYTALRDALNLFGEDPLASDQAARISGLWAGGFQLSREEHLRAIGLFQSLGQIALQNATSPTILPYPSSGTNGPQTWDDAAEHYLSSALTAMLKLGLVNRSTEPNQPNPQIIVGRDIEFPENSKLESGGGKVDTLGLGITMESLAEVYARKGQYDLSNQLLVQAISTLLPPTAGFTPPIRDQCQGMFLFVQVF